MLVVVGDGLVGVGGAWVGGGCGGAVSPAPGVGGGGELDLDGGAQDGGGLVAHGGVGVDDEGLGDDDLGARGLTRDTRAGSDQRGGLAGGDRDRAGLGLAAGVGGGGVLWCGCQLPQLASQGAGWASGRSCVAVPVGLLLPHRRVRGRHRRVLLRRRPTRACIRGRDFLRCLPGNFCAIALVPTTDYGGWVLRITLSSDGRKNSDSGSQSRYN